MYANNEKCGGVHSYETLSYITAIISVLISVVTIVSNGLLMFIFWKRRRSILKQLFYKIIFNIIISDFLNGLIADNLTLSYVLREGRNLPVPKIQITISHVTFFIFGSVSVMTTGLLSIERQWALLTPFNYRIGMHTKWVYPVLVATWIISILMSSIYVWLGFYHSLLIFTSVTVTMSFIAIIITTIVYYVKLIRKPSRIAMQRSFREVQPQNQEDGIEGPSKQNADNIDLSEGVQMGTRAVRRDVTNTFLVSESQIDAERICMAPIGQDAQRPKLTRRNAQSLHSKHVVTEVEKRATKTFILVLIVFVVSYLPTCVMMIYMNSCRKCDCIVIHILRDVTYLSMVSGAFLRPIHFIACLRPLRQAFLSIFKCR